MRFGAGGRLVGGCWLVCMKESWELAHWWMVDGLYALGVMEAWWWLIGGMIEDGVLPADA